MDVKLVMFKSDGQRKDFPIINPTTIIGRAETCDLRVPLLSVSRRHCELIVSADQVKIRDLASSNGTYVNNQRINELLLAAGDRVVIGPIVFTLQIDGRPEEIQPVKTKGQLLAEHGQPGAEEIVDLEADVIAQPGASALEDSSAETVGADQAEEVDPIAALEALASESEKPDEQEEQSDQQRRAGQ